MQVQEASQATIVLCYRQNSNLMILHYAQGICSKKIIRDRLGIPGHNCINSQFNRIGLFAHQATDIAAVIRLIREALGGNPAAERQADQEALVSRYISGLEGPLSSDRVVGELAGIAGDGMARPGRDRRRVLMLSATGMFKRAKGRVKPWVRGARHRKRYRYHDHIFPDIPVSYLEARLHRLQGILGRFAGIRVRRIRRKIFEITSVPG